MSLHDRAGQIAQQKDLVDVSDLLSQYYVSRPNMEHPAEQVSFGTSGHRGSSLNKSFNEQHILAIVQAVVDYRTLNGVKGPMMLGVDTHALSRCAYYSALEVLTANHIEVWVEKDLGFTPTPVVSHAIIDFNNHNAVQCDGLILTPSHNPPQDGGIKYNPPHGGPADSEATSWIQNKANEYIKNGLTAVKRNNMQLAKLSGYIKEHDFRAHYISQLHQVINLEAIKQANIKLAADPLGGSGVSYWAHIADAYGLNIETVNDKVDPSFAFMSLDKDGKIRMDCSSPYAMASMLERDLDFDIAIGNDPDFDRHGIVCRGTGLMNPNHMLAVAIDYLSQHRPNWPAQIKIGKTIVSSSMIDRVCADKKLNMYEVPVGFKWFVEGMAQGEIGFCGEESAGASLLKLDGSTWCTDKDGIILGLLAAEILAVTGKTPAQYYQDLTAKHGQAFYQRLDAPINLKAKAVLQSLQPQDITATELAGEAITACVTQAPGNGASFGGIKVSTENGWFAARPSGTEPLYKIYGESFISEQHLQTLLEQAKDIVWGAIKSKR
ncbi:phosphoglucomutase (alpha-D-glucose-1,6-bisphosphate-dependent) [Paraferrimonas sp. SM1919]|uniref:phosphoglucomutase (alpha-D-glucose-1,6-bisphosphate-dependent) n=1 Tax=Paraferrimonas sp. SM1919 TaxID=2662263 RepID=UPI0013D1A4EA|nr:phosphoglucomutase (alpha-D-glucose-1,6-bisphosphate-dependent) [Paraferrimonas sp. SM1919]